MKRVICNKANEHIDCLHCFGAQKHDDGKCQPCPIDENARCLPCFVVAEDKQLNHGYSEAQEASSLRK